MIFFFLYLYSSEALGSYGNNGYYNESRKCSEEKGIVDLKY